MMAVAAWLGIASVLAAVAQQVTPSPAQQSTPSYSDDELRTFAVAVLEVQKINNLYLPRLEAASTTEEQQQVVEAAKVEVAQVIQKQGITINRFHQILGDAQADTGLADKVRKLIREVQ